ncbi:acetylornithine/succinylornithine family transaminase [Desulfothermus sp.]
MEHSILKERENKFLFNTYARYPIEIKRGQGTKLYDFNGKEYTDLLAGIAVCNLGHANMEIGKAISEQAKKLVHVSNLFYTKEQIDLAEKLINTTSHMSKVFFCNSGAEANEACIKLARRYFKNIKNQDKFETITLEGSFHGRTFATMSATGQEKIKEGFEPLVPGFVHAKPNDLKDIEGKINNKTAAIMIEVIQGEGGIRPLEIDFVKGIEELCKLKGLLFIVDEIQTGIGRTGKMWGFEHYNVKPHIISCAKALANGLPIGAMMATEEVAKAFGPGTHATTFGGGPVVCMAALKVLEIIFRDNLIDRAKKIGEFALSEFKRLQDKYPRLIKEVRGIGLMLGIELTPGVDAKKVFDTIIDKGFIVNLTQGSTLRLLPPLIIKEEEIKAFSNTLDDILSKL